MTGNPEPGTATLPAAPALAPLQPLQPALAASGVYVRWGKPLLDRVVGSLALLAAMPLLGLVAVAVRLHLGRPVLLRQTRIGHHGRPFVLYKFRTMHPDRRIAHHPHPGPNRRRVHKHPDDPRHTPLGRLLRRYSLDELPQLLNVARGQMSLVGPRPELPQIVERYQPWQHARHSVKPGLSGLWQVTERGNGLMHQHTEIDLRYVAKVSFRGDLAILARTIPTLLGRRNPGH
jgi:lipopolysaccharide/colanic/teichoic acid biosynthesis glycosyltransferase